MYIAIDIGGTNTRVALFSSLDPKTKIGYKKIQTSQSYKDGLENIIESINNLVLNQNILAISIAIASTLDTENKSIVSPNITEWKAEKVATALQNTYNSPVKILNDATAGTLAEAVLGIGKNLDSFTFLIWGTGLGGSTIEKTGGTYTIYEYEPGHLQLGDEGRLCGCGKTDCIECYVGGKAVEKYFGKKMSAMDTTEWDAILNFMAQGIQKILEKHPTQNLVLGGNVISKHPHFVQHLNNIFKSKGLTCYQSLVEENAPLYGALIYLKDGLQINLKKKFLNTS